MVIRRSSLRMSTRTVWLTERSDISPARPARRCRARARSAPIDGGDRCDAAGRPWAVAARDAQARGVARRASTGVGGANGSRAGGRRRRRGGARAALHRCRARCAPPRSTTSGPVIALRSSSTEARLAIRISSSIVSASAPDARGQVRDDLAVRPRLGLELVERGVDRGEREADADAVEAQALLDVRAKAVLLVLGEHAEEPGIELVLRDDAGAARPRAAARPGRARRAAARPRATGSARLALLGGEDRAVERDRLEEQVEHARRRARRARGAGRRARPRARARAPPCASRRRGPRAP